MCTLIFVYVLPIYGAECIYMLTHIFDRTRQKTRVLQRGFMPPALRAHVIIPVFRGAYAPRYEYAAPVGALFSLLHLSIFIPSPVGLCFRSSPRYIHTGPCRALFSVFPALYSYRLLSGSVFGLPLAVFIPPPVGALFSVIPSLYSYRPLQGLCFRSRTFACNLSQSCFPYSRAWQKNRARRSLFLRAR